MKSIISIIIIFSLLQCSFCYNNAFATSFVVGGIRINKEVKPFHEIKNEKVVRQSLDFSCGAAGLSTLLQFYLNDPVNEEEIINTLLQFVDIKKVKARKGFSLLDLKRFAQAKGYKVTGYKMDFEFLRELGKPVLVPIKFKSYRHFVIVRGVIADRVFIADPASGNLSMKTYQFAKMWLNGIGLIVEHGNMPNGGYGKSVALKDTLIANYSNLVNGAHRTAVRTAVYANEWKM